MSLKYERSVRGNKDVRKAGSKMMGKENIRQKETD